MIRLVLGEVRMTDVAREPVLILREAEGDRTLPIWLSAASAHAVLAASDEPGSSPGIHELLLDILSSFEKSVDEVRITGMEEGVFAAEVRIGETSVNARLSDAVALALRCGAEIWATDELMDTAAVTDEPSPDAEPPLDTDDQVERFRAFLDTINPDDFDAPGGEA